MASDPFKDFESKESLVLVYTGDGKGKTSASIGLMCRALGADMNVAYIQFVKAWEVSEHKFIKKIQNIYKEELFFYKGGEGFYDAGDLSAKDKTEKDHKIAAQETYATAKKAVSGGDYGVVICDEINNAVHDGLLGEDDLLELIKLKHKKTSLCFTGRNFPDNLLDQIDIATEMTKLKHHFDDKFLANKGIDY